MNILIFLITYQISLGKQDDQQECSSSSTSFPLMPDIGEIIVELLNKIQRIVVNQAKDQRAVPQLASRHHCLLSDRCSMVTGHQSIVKLRRFQPCKKVRKKSCFSARPNCAPTQLFHLLSLVANVQPQSGESTAT